MDTIPETWDIKTKKDTSMSVGRKDDLMKVNGHRINPQEIEDAIMETGLVIEAVVLGMPDAIKGHRLIGVATPKRKRLYSGPDFENMF